MSSTIFSRFVCLPAFVVGTCWIGGCSSRVVKPTTAPAPLAARTVKGEAAAAPHGIRVSPQRFLSHIAVLAHDELEGRGTGSDGIDIAAGYIAGQFAAIGLQPGGPNGTYFQKFTLPKDAKLLDTTKLHMESPSPVTAELRTDFIPFGFSAQGEFAGDAAFAGYGITNPEKNHDDYANLDVTGKVVLMLRREPPGWREGGGFTDHARFEKKVALAREKGAIAVLIANQDPGEGGEDGLMPMRQAGDAQGIPALHVKRTFADSLLAAGKQPSLTELQKRIDEQGERVSAMLPGVRAAGNVAIETQEMAARNVIGVLPGTGARSNQYVVIGGHYDHLGVRRGRIYNGADDNASGTSAVIELARELSSVAHRDRSMIFMAFTGEEIGLEGSRFYCSTPTVPIESIAAMINMDMIGRLDSDNEDHVLAIQGLGTGLAFKEIVERRTAAIQLPYLPDDSAMGPSDHDSFYRKGVPSLFFFTGDHADYHQPGDDVEKVNAPGGALVAELVGEIAMDLVNGAASPVFAKVDRPANVFRGSRASSGGGVVMGVMPDMEDESNAKGWRIAQVTPGGGAAKAGMKSGDRILSIDGREVNDVDDYREITAGRKPGDTINVTVRRDSQEVTLSVELAARGG